MRGSKLRVCFATPCLSVADDVTVVTVQPERDQRRTHDVVGVGLGVSGCDAMQEMFKTDGFVFYTLDGRVKGHRARGPVPFGNGLLGVGASFFVGAGRFDSCVGTH